MIKLPEVGKVYAFYDDGKVGESRQYLAMVTRVIPFNSTEANCSRFGKSITTEDNVQFENKEKYEFLHSLKEYWKYNMKNFDWIFAKETDYFIECAVPVYDEHLLYFARMKNGEWFSFEVQSDWQCGFLDVEGRNDEFLMEELKDKRNKNILL